LFACHSALHSLIVFCWAKAAGAAQSIAISVAQRIPANRGFIFGYLVLEKVGGPAIGPLSFFLAFFHEAVFGRSRKRLAIFVDRLRLTGIPDTFCHEATQRAAPASGLPSFPIALLRQLSSAAATPITDPSVRADTRTAKSIVLMRFSSLKPFERARIIRNRTDLAMISNVCVSGPMNLSITS
jgi:hypothetical protein